MLSCQGKNPHSPHIYCLTGFYVQLIVFFQAPKGSNINYPNYREFKGKTSDVFPQKQGHEMFMKHIWTEPGSNSMWCFLADQEDSHLLEVPRPTQLDYWHRNRTKDQLNTENMIWLKTHEEARRCRRRAKLICKLERERTSTSDPPPSAGKQITAAAAAAWRTHLLKHLTLLTLACH